MKVLVVSNAGALRCGIAEQGRQMVQGLQQAGADTVAWLGDYEAVCTRQRAGEPGYFPADVETYDVVVVNWHPLTLNHYTGVSGWPDRPLRVGIIHEQTDAYCPFRAAFDRIEAPEVVLGDEHPFDYPCVAYESPVPTDPPVVLGVSSLRGDGYGPVAALCAARGWTLNAPGPVWLPIEAEVDRLARSTVNVAWYHDTRGKASGVMTLVAARRPVVISDSSMFSSVWDWDGIYAGTDLAETVDRAIDADVPPRLLAYVRTWPILASRWLAAWASAPRRRS